MHDWRAFVREPFESSRVLTNAAIDELAEHVEETWHAARSAGCSEAEAPPTFRFTQRATAVWVPIAFNDEDANRGSHSFSAAARLRPGVTITAAKSEVDAIGRAIAKQYPDSNDGETAVLTPMNELGVRDLRPTLLALVGAVAFVLLIACVNVANLLLAQGSSRRQEFAVRASRGASRWRIARQLVAEGIVIAVFGGTTGLAVAWDATALLEGVLPGSIVFAPFRDSGNGCPRPVGPWLHVRHGRAHRPSVQPRADRRAEARRSLGSECGRRSELNGTADRDPRVACRR